MTRTCYTSEKAVFDEPAINNMVADIEIEEVFDFTRSDEFDTLDMFDGNISVESQSVRSFDHRRSKQECAIGRVHSDDDDGR